MLAATLTTLTPRMRFNFTKPVIENIVFKLHYQLTVTLLLAFVILVCAREYFGEHIKCISDQGVPDHVIQTYCFFMATFTIGLGEIESDVSGKLIGQNVTFLLRKLLPAVGGTGAGAESKRRVRHYNESLLQSGLLPHPGVGPLSDADETLSHTYYQWVPFVLFIQSICFYAPHYIWKKKEGGRIRMLVEGLQYASLALEDTDMNFAKGTVPSKKSLQKKLDTIRKDIVLRLRITRTWSTWLVAMEITNMLHVMLQIWIINIFLNGRFIGLGSNVIGFDNWDGIADPLETVFPKVTKCIFHKYGPSGSIQQHDALCVMALNIIHEKIYVALWFWFLFLFIVSTLAVIWRLASYFLYRRSLRFNELVFRKASTGKFNPYNVIQVVNGCQFGDWLFLYYLAKNMHGFVFQELFNRLAEELEKRELPDDNRGHEEKGAEPVLVGRIDYDDETLPLKDEKKSS